MKKEMGNQMKWNIRANYFGVISACFVFLLIYFFRSDQFADRIKSVSWGSYITDVAAQQPLIPHEKQVKEQIEPNSPIVQEIPVERKQIGPSSPIAQQTPDQKFPGKDHDKTKPFKKPFCDLTDPHYDLCDLEGDIRINGKSGSVISVTSDENSISESNKTWSIKPHPRKWASDLMMQFRDVNIKVDNHEKSPKCDVHHNSSAVVFAVGGYIGNYFHAFTDVLVPLFITSYQFKRDVQFLVSNNQPWFSFKYRGFFKKLSNYEIIDFDKEEKIHCYSRVIVGLYKHKDLTINPSRSPNKISTVDFGRFARDAFSLEKNHAIKLQETSERKPRLLIMARNHSRSLTNLKSIVPMIKELGFEVVIGNALFFTDVGDFAHLVNSADVMMGVHGAGLTNFMFLPANAILIQIVPFGNFEKTCEYDFGEPATDMSMRYLQYSITKEESTLMDLYPKDHLVFRDPDSFHKQGWQVANDIYLGKQSVKLNFTRFRPVLEKALELLRQ
ncbi:hypothetical protein LUZ60_009850 [Juncus effusus]|nr:hypothetical protein LUZ60_009850 [Juncus effusus]